MKNPTHSDLSDVPPDSQKHKNDLKPLTGVLDDLYKKGYTADFRFEKKYLIPLQDPSKRYGQEDIEAVNFFRFEGDTDPSDGAILYSIEARDGMKGTIVNGYGVNADPSLDEFLAERVTKKVD